MCVEPPPLHDMVRSTPCRSPLLYSEPLNRFVVIQTKLHIGRKSHEKMHFNGFTIAKRVRKSEGKLCLSVHKL